MLSLWKSVVSVEKTCYTQSKAPKYRHFRKKSMDIDQTQDCCFTHEENSVLVATNDACDFYYSIGGGVHLDESAEEAVHREVLEETGLPYEIDRLAFVHENFFEGGRKYRRAALPRAFLLFSDEAHGQAGDHEARAMHRRRRTSLLAARIPPVGLHRLSPVLRRVAPSFATGDRPHRHRPPPEISAENFRQNPMDKLTLGRFFVTIIAQKTNVSVHGR